MKTLLFATTIGAALLFGAGALQAHSEEAATSAAAHGPVLSLSAYGETKATPDMATVTLGVTVEAPTAAAAMSQNRARMAQTLEALRKAGIADKDIRTVGVNLSTEYTYRQNEAPLLRGYQAANEVSVTVWDLARLGEAIDAAVAAGGNQVNGVSLGLRDQQKAEDAARIAAVRALQAKAQIYAEATGRRLKSLKSLSEGVAFRQPEPMAYGAMAKFSAQAPATPVSPGQLTLRIEVQGVYELE